MRMSELRFNGNGRIITGVTVLCRQAMRLPPGPGGSKKLSWKVVLAVDARSKARPEQVEGPSVVSLSAELVRVPKQHVLLTGPDGEGSGSGELGNSPVGAERSRRSRCSLLLLASSLPAPGRDLA